MHALDNHKIITSIHALDLSVSLQNLSSWSVACSCGIMGLNTCVCARASGIDDKIGREAVERDETIGDA
jgi:hypothetical protein